MAASSPSSLVFVVGRFPPPLDGQAIATEQLAALLEEARPVRRVSVSAPEGVHAVAHTRLRPARILHYLRIRRQVRQALAEAPGAPVLWPAVSSTPLGHARDLLAVAPSFQPGQAVFAVVHRGDFDRLFRSPLTRVTARSLLRRLRGVVFLSETLAERCAPWVPRAQRIVIPNTISEAVHCSAAEVAAKQAARRERHELRLLFLSNMIPSKGYADVVEAAALLQARGIPIKLDLAGRWESEAERVAFERQVTESGLGSVVTHHGGLSDAARVRALYLAADVFLLPTYYPTEAQPLTILEALNAGTPVVATSHAGIPDVVRDDGEGLLVPPRNPEALADAVARLHEPATWLGFSQRAHARFEEAYSADGVRTRWLDLLDRPA